MPSFYERQRATATKLINKRGRLVQVRRKVTYGPSHSPVSTNDDTPASAIVGEAVAKEARGVQTGDKRFTLVSDLVLTTTDFIVDGGVQYSIIAVRDTKPGELSIVQTVWCRV